MGHSDASKEDHKSWQNEFIVLTRNYDSIQERFTLQVESLRKEVAVKEMHLRNDLDSLKALAIVEKELLDDDMNSIRSQVRKLLVDGQVLFERLALLEEQNGADMCLELDIKPGASVFKELQYGSSDSESTNGARPASICESPILPPSPNRAAGITMAPDSVSMGYSILPSSIRDAGISDVSMAPDSSVSAMPSPDSFSITPVSDSLSNIPPRGLHTANVSALQLGKAFLAEGFKCLWTRLTTNWVLGKCPAFCFICHCLYISVY